jgi:hypothetical protein
MRTYPNQIKKCRKCGTTTKALAKIDQGKEEERQEKRRRRILERISVEAVKFYSQGTKS